MLKKFAVFTLIAVALVGSYAIGRHQGYVSGAQWTQQQQVNTFNDGWNTALYGDGK